MADVAAGLGPEGAVGWSRDLSDEEKPPVYVPGVSAERHFGARHLLKGQKRAVKPKEPILAAPAPPMDAFRSTGAAEVDAEQAPAKGGMKSASLKDLCPEDKRRIANLIKELARVSEEKEVTEERLKAEQETFEKKIRQLEEQNELIIREREALQQQYRECQELLSLYQKYLSEQQEKLTHSLSELEAANQKEQQMSAQRSRSEPPPSLELDGSHLSIARPQTLCKNNRVACGSPARTSLAQPCKNTQALGVAVHCNWPSAQNEVLLENGLRGKCNNVSLPFKQKEPPHAKRTPVADQGRSACPLQTCFFHQKLGSTDRDSFQDGCHIPPRQAGPSCEFFPDCSHVPCACGPNGSAGLEPKEAERGKKLSEDRRQQLLLQKMELEIEKERLQNLLAKQEAKLLIQQQRLQQSRLDYHRFKGRTPNSEELFTDEALMSRGGLAPVMNGVVGGLSSPKPSCESCCSNTPATGKRCKAPGSSGGNSSGKKTVGFNADGAALSEGMEVEAVGPKRGLTSGCRKDVATSPGLTGGRKELGTAATSPIRHGTSRYEASLFDLVEAMSLGLQHQQHYGESRSPHKTLMPRSNRTLRTPGFNRSPSGIRNGAAELEESRILEEIFFI